MIRDKIINKIISKEASDEVVQSSDYTGVPLNKEFFHEIRNNNKGNGGVVHAVDGGSSVLCDGGGWIISKVKIGMVEYEETSKVKEGVKDYYVLIVNKEGYEILVFDSDENQLSIELPEFESSDIDDIPSKVMKILEWRACEKLCRECDDVILMDSSLEADNEVEKRIIRKTSEFNNLIIGFCKTSRLRTTSGRSLLGVVNSLSPENEAWYYHPIYEDEALTRTYITKLKKNGGFCHKVQIFQKDEKRISELFTKLSFFASDSETLGYPYPLFKADKIARINSFEKRSEVRSFAQILKQTDLIHDTRSQGFHSVLDDRMYR